MSIFSFLSKQYVKNPKYKDAMFKVNREVCSQTENWEIRAYARQHIYIYLTNFWMSHTEGGLWLKEWKGIAC